MKKVLVVFAAAMLVAGAAGAYDTYSFHCAGAGDMVNVSPCVYSGGIDGGDLAPGTWSWIIDDAGWPSVLDPAARWAYIWTNYYAGHYVAGNWTGTFDGHDLYLEKTGNGTLSGVCDVTFQITDYDQDGILDPDECMNGLSGVMIIINEGTGEFAELCGQGSYSGYYMRDCGGSWADLVVDFDVELNLAPCAMGTEPSTWGSVKALFQ